MRSNIEPLETRVAPAAVFVSPTTATYKDVDGDVVTVKFSKSILTPGTAGNTQDILETMHSGAGDQLTRIDLIAAGSAAHGIDVTVTAVKKNGHGDKSDVNVGYIQSFDDVGRVTIDGDLGRIDAGDGDTSTPALKSLTVQSLGRLGTTTGAPDYTKSFIYGSAGSIVVKGDVANAAIIMTAFDNTGTIGSIFIGGSLVAKGGGYHDASIFTQAGIGSVTIVGSIIGGDNEGSGKITAGQIRSLAVGGSIVGGTGYSSGGVQSFGPLGTVFVGHDLRGGVGAGSGVIESDSYGAGAIGSVIIGGSIVGGQNTQAGGVLGTNGDIGSVIVLHDVRGGTGLASGFITSAYGGISTVAIGGSLIGGNNSGSGVVSSGTELKTVIIGGDIRGGSSPGTYPISETGALLGGHIGSVFVGGSIKAGIDNGIDTLTNSGAIVSAQDIGSIVVKGSLTGSMSASGEVTPVMISANGQLVQGLDTDLAIGSIRVGGSVKWTNIVAGSVYGYPTNADAQIGTVVVGGDWIASSIAAGALPGPQGFGVGDTKGGYIDNPLIISKIASITIGGQIRGTSTLNDHFGFVAEQIGALKIGGVSYALDATPHNNTLNLGSTGDVTLHEI